jgi:hypothetical protein
VPLLPVTDEKTAASFRCRWLLRLCAASVARRQRRRELPALSVGEHFLRSFPLWAGVERSLGTLLQEKITSISTMT